MKQPADMFLDFPDAETIRHDSIRAGGSDPLSLRFRVVEYESSTGDFVRVLQENSGFLEALENTSRLVAGREGSHFRLEPVCFVQ